MKRAYRWMNAVLLSVTLAGVTAAYAQDAAKPAYTLAEYNAQQDAHKETDPQAQIKKLDAFVTMYPQSILAQYVYTDYYTAYYKLKDYVHALEWMDKYIALSDDKLSPDPSKPDPAKAGLARLNVEVNRAKLYYAGSGDKSLQTPEQYTAARDSASKGLQAMASASGLTDAQKSTVALTFNLVGGLSATGLKDYKAAENSYKAALAAAPMDPSVPITHYRLGADYLQEMPPNMLDGTWEVARSVALKVQGADQVKAYLKNQILRYQLLSCDKLADGEVDQLVTLAAAGDARPATYTLPSADDLKKAQDDTANFIPWLQEGGDHGKVMWLATCGVEYPDVAIKIIDIMPGDAGNFTLQAFRSAASDPDQIAKDMDAATMANMTIKVVGEPEASRLAKDDEVRFTGTLTDYQAMPFMLTWDNAKINMDDIPPDKPAPGAKRPARKVPGAK